MNNSNFHQVMLAGPYASNSNINNFGKFLRLIKCGKFWLADNLSWELEFSLFNPVTWILLLGCCIINPLFYFTESRADYKDLFIFFLNTRCTDKKFYYNKKNIENSKNKLMAYL